MRKNLIIFILLSLVVNYIQKDFLSLVLTMGLKPDDWILYFHYKALGDNPLSKIGMVWAERGAYTTYQLYFLGLLGNSIGFNWQLFRQIDIYFKIIATLSLYPLILVVFKRRLLALLATIIYAVNYASVGPFEFVVKGSDYLAIFWMHAFLFVYYFMIKKKLRTLWWLIIGTVLLMLTIIFSPIRLYPLLIIILIIEAYLLIIRYRFTSIRIALLRLLVLYSPFILLILYSPKAILGYLSNPFEILRSGNWQTLLSPLSGVGYLFVINRYFGKLFGSINVNSLPDYTVFLLGGPLVIFGGFTLLLNYLRIHQPRRFFLTVVFINLIFESLIFHIAFHYKSLPENLQQHYDPTGLYSVLVGIYILILSFTIFLIWARNKHQDSLLGALSLGGLFSIIFTFAIWIAAPTLISFSATSYYLVVSALGSSIFISALLTMIFDKFQATRFLLIKLLMLITGLTFLAGVFFVSRNEIKERFTYFNLNGLNLMAQQQLHDKFKLALGKTDNLKNALFFFDTSYLSGNGPFYSEGFLVAFPFWMHFNGNNLRDGCFEIIYENKEKASLKKTVKMRDNEQGFYYRGLCLENGKWGYRDLLYKKENFYAYKIVNGEFIDIKNEVLYDVGLK